MKKEIGMKVIEFKSTFEKDYSSIEREISSFFEEKNISLKDVQITHSIELRKISSFSKEIDSIERYTIFYPIR